MRLNLGCGKTRIEGFTNYDKNPLMNPDILGDVRDLSRFSDNSIDEILASHILEHFPHRTTIDILKEWHRVLIPGGLLRVAVPDWDRIIEVYRKEEGMGPWIIDVLYGSQKDEFNYHYICFTYPNLLNVLSEAGFKNVERVETFEDIEAKANCEMGWGGWNLCSTSDMKSVVINIKATK